MYLGVEAVVDGPAETELDGGEGAHVEDVGLVGLRRTELVRAVHAETVVNQLMKGGPSETSIRTCRPINLRDTISGSSDSSKGRNRG